MQISSRFYVHTPDTQLFYLKSLHFSHALSHLDDFVWSTIFCTLVYMPFITWFIAVTLEHEFMTYTMLAMWLAGTSNGSSSSSIQTSTVVLKSSVWCIELHADHCLRFSRQFEVAIRFIIVPLAYCITYLYKNLTFIRIPRLAKPRLLAIISM